MLLLLLCLIVYGVTYVHPIHSRFYENEEFDIFQTEVSQMSAQYELLFLCGDFNSQTAELADYTTCDTFLDNYFDFDVDIQNVIGQKNVLEASGIILTRN